MNAAPTKKPEVVTISPETRLRIGPPLFLADMLTSAEGFAGRNDRGGRSAYLRYNVTIHSRQGQYHAQRHANIRTNSLRLARSGPAACAPVTSNRLWTPYCQRAHERHI